MVNNTSFVSYDSNQSDIVKSGIDSIINYFTNNENNKKRSLLLCLDKYLDPYYGYNLEYFNQIIDFLQQQLFKSNDDEIMDDIFQLIADYNKGELDFLAENITKLDLKYLESGIYALSCTWNKKYVPIFISFENHFNKNISAIAKQALIEIKIKEEKKKEKNA